MSSRGTCRLRTNSHASPARADGAARGDYLLGEAVGRIEGINRAKGVAVLESGEQRIDAGLTIVSGALCIEEDVLADEAEDREIAWEACELMIVHAE